MSKHQVVRLLTNQIYSNYQLHAWMGSSKTTPQEGLRLGALVVLDWLKDRLGQHAPQRLLDLPKPADFRSCGDEVLFSAQLNQGFMVDVAAVPEQGLWSLQITEPDLGSDPGNPEQERQAVPGRVIVTNIGFCIVGSRLECGFQTLISDPEGTETPADVYRLSVVRRLVENTSFGLTQVVPLKPEAVVLTGAEQLRKLEQLWRDEAHELPCVVFTHPREEIQAAAPNQLTLATGGLDYMVMGKDFSPIPEIQAEIVGDVPYQVDHFAANMMSFCRTYVLDDSLLKEFSKLIGQKVTPGDAFLLEPKRFGGKVRVYPYKPGKARQQANERSLEADARTYFRGKVISFGNIHFSADTRNKLLESARDAMVREGEAEAAWVRRSADLTQDHLNQMKEKEKDYGNLALKLQRKQDELDSLAESKRRIEADLKEEKRLRAEDAEKAQIRIRRLEETQMNPRRMGEIPAWVKERFDSHMLLHSRAIREVQRCSRRVDIRVLCDALEFMATEFWEYRYNGGDEQAMRTACNQRYGRPFDIQSSGGNNVDAFPSQYHILYPEDPADGREIMTCPLDEHLKIGNNPATLIRIYFYVDKEKKKIVVGSMPNHLDVDSSN